MEFRFVLKRALLSSVAVTAATAIIAAMIFSPRLRAQDDRKGAQEETRLIQSLNGQALFQAYCASCHGKDGKGAGPAAPALKARPSDLTQISKNSGGKYPSERIQKIISGEELVRSAHGSREMPIWGPIFSQIAWDQDLGRVRVANLARYIESLQGK